MPSHDRQLEMFVRHALRAGQSRPDIKAALVSAGWPLAQIERAIGSFAEIDFPIPVPKPRSSLNARDAFLYLVMFSALYCAAWNLITLLFSFVDRAFPDRMDTQWSPWEGRTWATAALIIAGPVYLYLARVIARDQVADPSKRATPVRRWLTYMTLFIGANILMIDATSLIHGFLAGELGIRFLLKTLIIGSIVGAIFGFYLTDLRKEEQ